MSMKLTMKEPYSKSKFLSIRFRGYIDLLRPFTLAAPFFVSMFIMFASLVYNDRFADFPDWWITIGQASLTLTFLNAASNALNQATDAEADKISKPYRPIPRGVVEPAEAQSIAYILYLFALLRAVTINVWFGVFVFLIMIFTVTYSLPPRMKRFLFINQLWIAIPRGLLGILASWSVFGDPFQREPIVIGTMAFLFFAGAMTTKDIVDREADKRTGVRTLVNTFGTKKSALISLPFMFLPFALVPLLIGYHILSYYFLPLTIFTILSITVFFLLLKESESKTLENVYAWSFMYLEYLLFAMGFTLLIIFGEMGSLTFLA
ncbi:MAG: UbiA prenyltransferase family protein [Thermoplasmatales archaeon]|nr:MAG: UbiA prenyltransferase family protein [Thermoplasmatales archaeon]